MFSEYQTNGIDAYDCILKEEVLVLPAVLALLGDNPMQSELSCHIGLAARLFYRICWVSTGRDEDDDDNENNASERDPREDGDPQLMDVDEDQRSVNAPSNSRRSGASSSRPPGKKGRILETVDQMIDRVKRFLRVCINTSRQFLHADPYNTERRAPQSRGLDRTPSQYFHCWCYARWSNQGKADED